LANPSDFFKLLEDNMEIKIKRIGTQVLTGNASGIINTYMITEDSKEFLLTRTSRAHGSSLGIAGKEGILYVDSEDNRVHRQVVALSGACGLNTDDEVVEELSPWSLRGVILADQRDESGEIKITSDKLASNSDQPIASVDGRTLGSLEL
jgi:hypothetical protein